MKNLGFIGTIWMAVLFVVPLACANTKGYQIVSAPEVKHMMESENAIVVNVLSKIEYDMQRIPDSIHVLTHDMETTKLLPKDKNAPIIFHCMGVLCPFSEKACKKAVILGYKKVFWFKGGIPEWHRYHYPVVTNENVAKIKVKKLRPKQVNTLMTTDSPLIIDVRPQTFKSYRAFMPQVTHIPLMVFHEKYASISNHKKLVITDAFMKQSPIVAKFLISKGYNVIGIVKGGTSRWEKDGFPIIYKD